MAVAVANIVEFLNARYAEEAKRWQTIWRFQAGDRRIDGWWDLGGTFGSAVNAIVDTSQGGRDLAAKRAILALALEMAKDEIFRTAADLIVRNLAAPYFEHTDFNPAWRME